MPVIEASALSPMRAVAAEIATAYRMEKYGFATTVRGGRVRGHDVVAVHPDHSAVWLVDAKLLTSTSASEQAKGAGTWKIARQHHLPWTAKGRTHLALVALPDEAEYTGEEDRASVAVPLSGASVHVVTVAAMNLGLVPRRGLRYLWLDDDWLDGLRRW